MYISFILFLHFLLSVLIFFVLLVLSSSLSGFHGWLFLSHESWPRWSRSKSRFLVKILKNQCFSLSAQVSRTDLKFNHELAVFCWILCSVFDWSKKNEEEKRKRVFVFFIFVDLFLFFLSWREEEEKIF